MASVARRLISRQIKLSKWQRAFSASAVVRKDEQFIIKSSYPNIVVPETRFLDRLWRESASFENHVALECAETKKSYTYSQLQKYMATFATSLRKKFNLQEGDVVMVVLPNCPEFPVVAFGALQAGCAVTTVNPIYKEFEIAHQARTTNPKIVVTIQEIYDSVVKGLKNANNDSKVVIVDKSGANIPDGAIRYSEIAETGEVDYALLDKVVKKNEDVAFIPFSSGTTGLPKGVDITYGNLLAGIEMMQVKGFSYPELTQGNFQDILPCVLPFFHIYGLVVTLIGHLAKGCKLVTLSRFSAGLYFDVLKQQDVSLLYVVPPIALLLGKHPDVTKEHFRNVRHVVCGAAPLASSDTDPIFAKSNGKLQFEQGFGATETTSLTTATPMGAVSPDYSSCGVPMASVELKFVDPLSGQPVAIGESGEMYVRGPSVMKGYHNNEEATRDSLTEDGFFKTGDLGYYKPGVGLYITDRIKELIKVKGLQVAPAELESILRSHPAVQDAAVIGIPHEYFGEVPKAFIILKKDQKISEEHLQEFVSSKVASFKKIEEVQFVNNIPKTTSGKILRRELKRLYV